QTRRPGITVRKTLASPLLAFSYIHFPMFQCDIIAVLPKSTFTANNTLFSDRYNIRSGYSPGAYYRNACRISDRTVLLHMNELPIISFVDFVHQPAIFRYWRVFSPDYFSQFPPADLPRPSNLAIAPHPTVECFFAWRDRMIIIHERNK